MLFVQPGKVAKHPLPEERFRLRLMLDVDQKKRVLSLEPSLRHKIGFVALPRSDVGEEFFVKNTSERLSRYAQTSGRNSSMNSRKKVSSNSLKRRS